MGSKLNTVALDSRPREDVRSLHSKGFSFIVEGEVKYEQNLAISTSYFTSPTVAGILSVLQIFPYRNFLSAFVELQKKASGKVSEVLAFKCC